MAETALVEVGAFGLGAIVTAAFSSAAMDITGILAAGTIAALGLFVIPARRRKAQKELRRRVTELRERLLTALEREFERELVRGLQQIEEAIAPYTRFVRSEQALLERCQRDLTAIKETLAVLQERVETL